MTGAAHNPYQAPTAPSAPPPSEVGEASLDRAIAIRQEHINHETSIRSVAILYWLGTALLIVTGMASLHTVEVFDLYWAFFFLGLATIYAILGYGLRNLKPWCRFPVAIIQFSSIFSWIPVGSIISLYILWLVFSKKGRFVFTPEYAEIIAQTPDVKCKTSAAAKIVALLLLIALIAFIIFLILASS